VTRNDLAILQAYPDLEVDPDLVLFGGLVHDIGKTVTYGMENDEPVFRGNSDALLGHTYFGVHIVQTYLDEYDLEEDFKYQALHMIGSHMRDFRDGGVLCSPKMLEVIIVNFADNSDALLTFGIDVLSSLGKGEGREAKGAGLYLYKSKNPCFLPEEKQKK
jgi:putative nucleotidyltransferase with HDIG domain